MVFTIDEIKNYLLNHKSIESAISGLTEQAIIESIPIGNFESLNYEKNKENLLKYEDYIGMSKRKKEQRILYRNSNGEKGRNWLACSPKWIDDKNNKVNTKYEIRYWVNYGDDNTFGWFTVEQIIEWFDNPNIFLHELGGTKER